MINHGLQIFIITAWLEGHLFKLIKDPNTCQGGPPGTESNECEGI